MANCSSRYPDIQRATLKTMRHALLITSCLIVLSPYAGAGFLNKCIDASGQVTYSNLPCKNAHEARKLEIDPPPQPDPAPVVPKTQRVKAERIEPDRTEVTETRRITRQPAAALPVAKCNTLADKLGRVIDKMDAARRKGYTQVQMDNWNQQVKDIERQKQQAGCF